MRELSELVKRNFSLLPKVPIFASFCTLDSGQYQEENKSELELDVAASIRTPRDNNISLMLLLSLPPSAISFRSCLAA